MDAQTITTTAAPSTALQQCFDEITDSAPMALERCLNHVVSELQQAEGRSVRAAERIELGDAWRELARHQKDWCKLYPVQLRAAFKGERAGRDDPDKRKPGGKLELSLVDETEIDGKIESSRLLREVMPLVERPVSELDALVSSAMGLTTIRPELNPVRPEIFAQSLRALIDRAEVKPATGTLWMRYLAEPLGQELQQLYGRLVVQLKDADVRAAGYGVTRVGSGPAGQRAPKPDDHRPRASGPAPLQPMNGSFQPQPQPQSHSRTQAQAQHPGHAGYAILSSRQITHALLCDFMQHGGGAAATQSLPPSYYAEVDREIAQLKAQPPVQEDFAPEPPPPAYREMAPLDRPQRAVGVQSALSREVWGDYAHSSERSLVRAQLRKDATQVAQVLGLELVRKVVNQVAQDPRLLTPVREAIVALEPALLRLAMVDPRFFTEEKHPGRQLMEGVAQRSFKYNDEFGVEFAEFFEGISACFNPLNQATIEDAQPFEDALVQLKAAWDEKDREDNDPRAQALKAMAFAERRQAEAGQIAWEMSSRTDLADVPAVVQDFLFGPWALVLAHARLTDTGKQIDPHGFLAVIPDLLWSVKPEVTLRQPAQLFARLPALLEKLKSGLALLGQQPEESEAFFQDLMTLHRPVLKLRRAKSRRDAQESGAMPLAAVDTSSTSEGEGAKPRKVEEGPWMSVREQDALGFEETLPTDMGQLLAHEEVSRPAPLAPAPAVKAEPKPPPVREKKPSTTPLGEIDAAQIFADMREGDWFDLFSKRKWLRAQLVWASSKATLFMFTSHGGQPHTMTKRICERLIRDRFLRPVRMHGVVAHALDAIKREDSEAAVPA